MKKGVKLWAAAANAYRRTPASGSDSTVDMHLFWVTAATEQTAKNRAVKRALAYMPPDLWHEPKVAVCLVPVIPG